MTADELRELLDRFHIALRDIEDWAEHTRAMTDPHPKANVELHLIWCELNRRCVAMRQIERRLITTLHKAAARPAPTPPPPPPNEMVRLP